MKIRSLETFQVRLPFRFAFGHALASRKESSNLLVKVTLENGCCGWGESVPRDYVTGETVGVAESNVLSKYAPEVLDLSFAKPEELLSNLRAAFERLGLRKIAQGASWCALELAILDAAARLHGKSLFELLGGRKQERLRYGGVIPFGSRTALAAILWFYRFYGYGTVKLKVGSPDLGDDLKKLKLARSILPKDCTIRVDANCAWTLEEALAAVAAFRPYQVSSYEQPLAAGDLAGLAELSRAITEDVVVDESLCTLAQASELAQGKICDAFNVRISKAGGLLAAQEMIEIAQANGLKVHLGAQVGESGILSAAARHLGLASNLMENYEGSANMFLLKQDICRENLTAGPGGYAGLKYAGKNHGLGVTVMESRVSSMTQASSEAPGAEASEAGSAPKDKTAPGSEPAGRQAR